MKNFFITVGGENVVLTKNINDLSGGITNSLDGNRIYFLEQSVIEDDIDDLEVFGNVNFNNFSSEIFVESTITSLPGSPANDTWYMVSSLTDEDVEEELYDYIGFLANYDSVNGWRYLKPFEGIQIITDGNKYVYNSNSYLKWVLSERLWETESFGDLAEGEETISSRSYQYDGGTYDYVVTDIGTSVTVRVEGSNNGSTFFNLNSTDADTTQTANGVYSLNYEVKCAYVRFVFVSAVDGTPNINVNLLLYKT